MHRSVPTWLRSSSRLAVALALTGLTALGSGCAKHSTVNPKFAWAFNESAPMSVVVHRADAAQKTSEQVDRLLGATPANLDSPWVAEVGPSADTATAQVKAISALPIYADSHARVVPSEVWSRTLAGLKSSKGQNRSLLSAIDKDLGDKLVALATKKEEVSGLRALLEAEQAAIDDKDATEADKATHQKKKDELSKMVETSTADLGKLKEDLLHGAKDAAAKAPPEVREKVGVAVVNLKKAVEEAQLATGAAAIRYPLATSSLADSVKEMVPVLAADLVEEQTGKRPDPSKLTAEVTVDGTNVTVSFANVTPGEFGRVKPADLARETGKRATRWIAHATGLLAAISATNDALGFQSDLLSALVDGFSAGGWKVIVAANIPTDDASGGDAKDGKATAGAVKSVDAAANKAGKDVTKSADAAAAKADKDVKAAGSKVEADVNKGTAKIGKDLNGAGNKVTSDVNKATKDADATAKKVDKDVKGAGKKVENDANVKGATKSVNKAVSGLKL